MLHPNGSNMKRWEKHGIALHCIALHWTLLVKEDEVNNKNYGVANACEWNDEDKKNASDI